MNEIVNLPRRLTAAERALIEAPESQQVVSWALDIVHRRGIRADRNELIALAHEAMVLAAVHYRPDIAPFAVYARKRVIGHIYDALRKDFLARLPTSTAALDAMVRQAAMVRAREGSEGTTPSDGEREASARIQARMARLAFELFVPTRLDTVDPERRLVWSDEQQHTVAALREARAELTPEEEKVIERHYVEQVQLDRIASELGVTYRTVKRIHRRARARLRRALVARGITSASQLPAT